MSLREKIDNLIIQADGDIQEKNISGGLQKLEIAKQMATELEWDERIGTITSLIEDANNKIKIQEEHDKKLKEIELKKLENEKKEKQLEIASQRLQDKKIKEKQQKLESLRKKKEFEDKLSSEAYDLLEIGSKEIAKEDFLKGIESFAQALEKFKTIKWSAEINRTQELLDDAEVKYKIYQQKLKDNEIKAEKVWEAQKKTREQIELSKKLQEQKLKEQESIDMEIKKEELLKKAKSDKALSLLDDAIQFRNLNQFDSATKVYKEALEIFKEIGWQKEAIEVEEEISLTNKQREKLELEKKKLEDNLIKKRLDEEEIEKKAKESHQLRDFKEKELRGKRQKELEILSQKEEKLTEVLANISKIEEIVNSYEDQVHLGKILSFESPYAKAIEIYKDGSEKLRKIGFNEQADRLADGENSYKERIFEDEKLRVKEKKRLEKIKQEEKELEKKAKEAQRIRDEKLRIEKEKRQKELEEISKKDSQLKIVLNNISIIEEVISGYESRVGLGKILSLECPYPKAVELYYIGSAKLRDTGLIEQADRLEEGGNTYKNKIIEDNRLRELEKKRLEKVRLDNEEIEEKARESKRLREEKLNLEKEKRQKELEKHSLKETQLKEVLSKISKMEDIIYIFENQGDFTEEKSPYPEAIELYRISSKKLSEFGFHEQAKLLKDGEVSYKQKLVKFNKNLEDKRKHLEKLQKDKVEIEKKTEEAQLLKEQKEEKLREKRQKELEKISKKESKLRDVLGDISKIEDAVRVYAKEVGLGKILSLDCPYPRAVELYNIGMNKLRETGLTEQADRLDEGRKTYELKIIEDKKLRSREKQRIEKARLDDEELEKKAEESQKNIELKEKELREKRQQELEALSKKESKLKTVLNDISKIEDTVNEYVREVGLGKILSLECPYPKAVELYNIGTLKLREAGLTEQADRLDEGRKTYELKIVEDEKHRSREKHRIEKARLDEDEIEKKAEEARRLKEFKESELREKRQQELEVLSKKESKLKTVLNDISEIEDVVSEYAREVGLGRILSLECPYPKAVELYNIGMNKLRETGLTEQADRLDEGRKTYELKIVEDEKHRSREKHRIEKARLDEDEIEKKAEEARKFKEFKESELREKRQQELEALSKKESRLRDVLEDISKIEDVVSEYAREVGLGKILSLECPYPKAVELYNIGMNKLRKAGLTEQADRLDEGRKTYELKIVEDEKHRSREKHRIEKARLDEDEIEKKAEEARKFKEFKESELREKRQQELEVLSKKESKLKTVLNDISKIEDVVSEYAREVGLGRILCLECPYPKAVELYNIGMNKLRETGLTEQADRLDEGRKTYELKIVEDEKHRSREKQRIEKTRLEIEEFKRKADESHRLKDLKDKELREKRQKELEAISQKESKLKNVLGDISKIEDVVNEYAKGIGLGKILSLECPYPRAVELYNIGTNKLREAGLIEQADRLDEGRKTYEKKIVEDKRLRELEKHRLTKIEVDKEKLEMQAQVAAKLEEIKQNEKGAQKKKEQEKLSNQREILTESLNAIDKIEMKVKKYEDQVSLGKILTSKCPYSTAIEVYKTGSEKLKQIGLLEQSIRLNEGYKLYKEKLIFDEKNRNLEEQRIRKDEEAKLELEQQIQKEEEKATIQKMQKEEEKATIQKKSQGDQNNAKNAFSLMDEGNDLAVIFKFDEAIEKFQEAMDIFDEIKWLAELDKVLLQISIFRKQKDQKELEKIEEEELKIKKQKDMEDIDKIAKLSWEKKLEEERKKSEIKQSETEEKKKQWELEFQRKIEEDKRKRETDEQIRLEQLKIEQEIGLEHQNVYNDCLNLLDQAKTMVTEQQFEPAIAIYKKVVEKYTGINYLEGIRITNESILKVQKLWDDHKFDIEIAQKSMKEREEEEKRLERLIKDSKQKDERNKLLEEQKKLKLRLEKEKDSHIQSEIISILEIAGDLTKENQFDKALEYYDKSLQLFKKIKWDLKNKQVLSIIQDVKAKKKHFLKLEKQFEEKQKKDQKAQKAFKDFLEKQEAERKSKGEKIKELTEKQKKEQDVRIFLEDAAYEYIDQAEICVKGRKFYLSLYYFHYALNNFIEIEWAREAKALKKRFLQVYNLISNPLIDINEFLNNPKLDTEYHFANSLSLILLAQKRKDFLVAQTELNTVCEMAKNLKWPKSLKLLEDFKVILEQEKEDYKREIEMKKYAPTEGKALQLMKEASGNIKKNEFEEGLALANKAKEIYIQMGIEREARKVEQELLRWKLKYTRYQLNLQREKTKAVGPEKKTFLSEDERKNLIIEERKRRRREARKKLMGD